MVLVACAASASVVSRPYFACYTSVIQLARHVDAVCVHVLAVQVRRSKKIKTECYLLQMQRFTGFADWARAKAAGDSAPKLKVIDAVLAKYDDANQLGRAVAEVEKVLGVKVPALFWQKDM